MTTPSPQTNDIIFCRIDESTIPKDPRYTCPIDFYIEERIAPDVLLSQIYDAVASQRASASSVSDSEALSTPSFCMSSQTSSAESPSTTPSDSVSTPPPQTADVTFDQPSDAVASQRASTSSVLDLEPLSTPSFCAPISMDIPAASPEPPVFLPVQEALQGPLQAILPSQMLLPAPLSPMPIPAQTILTNEKASSLKAVDVEKELMSKTIIRIVREICYFFDGKIYRILTVERLRRLIRGQCRSSVEAAGNATIIKQVLELIFAEPNIALDKAEEDTRFLAFDNGLLELSTQQFTAHSPQLFVTSMVDGNFLPQAAGHCPTFLQFLSSVTGGDMVLQRRIWEIIGYCLSPDSRGKCFFLFQGVPDSGKSLLGDFIASCFEEDAVTSLDLNAMGLQFGPSELVGKRLSLCMDLPSEPWTSKSVGVMKELTGNDLLTADIKYQPRIRFRNRAKLLFGSNHVVTTANRDDAFFRRMVVVPFRFSVPKNQQDRTLPAQFRAERDAIIATAMEHYGALCRNNYIFSGDYHSNEAVSTQTTGDILDSDQAIAEFFYRHCALEPDSFIFTEDIFQKFQKIMGISMEYNAFSAKFSHFIAENHAATVSKDRRRRTSQENAKSIFKGIRLKDG